jgi:general secretion pathway protein G
MRKCVPHGWLLNNSRKQTGLTLIELLVTLLILSILATAAIPFAEITVKRNKEVELQRNLRQIRTAIDRVHEDWKQGKLAKTTEGMSVKGYPTSLQALINGIETGKPDGSKIKYLRRIPRDPFANQGEQAIAQWHKRGYEDEVNNADWNGRDVFDVRSRSDRQALDGSRYKDW